MSAVLYEYAVFHNPTPVRDANGNDVTPAPKILVGPTLVVANSESEVQIQAARSIPEMYTTKLKELVIAVRPF